TGALASQTGQFGGPPTISNVGLADDPSGHFAVTAIIAALYQRERTGRGQHVRINMQEVVISSSRMSFVEQENMPKRGGAMLFAGKNAPRNTYPTKPRFEGDENNYVFILVRDTPNQEMWKNFCDVIERPDLVEDPRFLNGSLRLDNVEALETEILKWTTARDKEEVMRLLCEKMIPAGAVLTIKDIVNSKDMYESKFLQTIDHPSLGRITLPGSAYRMSDTYVPVEAAPDLGQHNREIYEGFLGLKEEEWKALKNEGCI
ncbi:MAG: CoA transferase, partial [Spirochaetales bacterium]|nr:CoA transferase [Spirochaetales bacterium]